MIKKIFLLIMFLFLSVIFIGCVSEESTLISINCPLGYVQDGLSCVIAPSNSDTTSTNIEITTNIQSTTNIETTEEITITTTGTTTATIESTTATPTTSFQDNLGPEIAINIPNIVWQNENFYLNFYCIDLNGQYEICKNIEKSFIDNEEIGKFEFSYYAEDSDGNSSIVYQNYYVLDKSIFDIYEMQVEDYIVVNDEFVAFVGSKDEEAFLKVFNMDGTLEFSRSVSSYKSFLNIEVSEVNNLVLLGYYTSSYTVNRSDYSMNFGLFEYDLNGNIIKNTSRSSDEYYKYQYYPLDFKIMDDGKFLIIYKDYDNNDLVVMIINSYSTMDSSEAQKYIVPESESIYVYAVNYIEGYIVIFGSQDRLIKIE
jgi:hypothetical protein